MTEVTPTGAGAQIAAELTTSLDGQPDEGAETAWAKEIERRAKRAVAGESKGKNWRAVVSRLRTQEKK